MGPKVPKKCHFQVFRLPLEISQRFVSVFVQMFLYPVENIQNKGDFEGIFEIRLLRAFIAFGAGRLSKKCGNWSHGSCFEIF